jgi:DnaJ domain
VIWAEAESKRITARNVIVRYADEMARLDRKKLWKWWAFWRGVRFVSSRDGRIAQELDHIWQRRYGRASGGIAPAMQMPLAEAMKLLHVPANFTEDDVQAAFRRAAKKVHPDVGGTAEQFRKLVEARDRLLASLGTSAPPPRPPEYAPKGMQVVYRRVKLGGQNRLGSTLRLGRAS